MNFLSITAYRTGVDFTLARPNATNWSLDSALTMEIPDGRVFGRHSTVTIEMDADHVRYVYNLGFKPGQTNCSVDTVVWWKAGWILQVHEFENRQPAVLSVGGYAISHADTSAITTSGDLSRVEVWTPEQGSVLQPLQGFSGHAWDQRRDDTTLRTHLRRPFHATPVTHTGSIGQTAGETGCLVALAWVGSDQNEAAAWAVKSSTPGHLTITHPTLGDWNIQHELLPSL